MTKPTPLHNADLIRAAADGHQMQVASPTLYWRDTDTVHALHLLATQPAVGANFWVRVKPTEPPRTITINGRIVPEPLRTPPQLGQACWIADVTSRKLWYYWKWSNDEQERHWLRIGMCHATQAAAVAHATALLSFTRQVENG